MNIDYHLRMWDTSGQERFSKLINSYYRNLTSAIIMFDLTRYDSFCAVERWHNEIMDKLDTKYKPYFTIMLVGNKSDLTQKRVITYSECIQLATKLGCTYIEISVKNCINTKQIVKFMVRDIINNITNKHIIPDTKNGIYISYKGENLSFLEKTHKTNLLNSDYKRKCCIIS